MNDPAVKKRGLGRGLSALLGDVPSPDSPTADAPALRGDGTPTEVPIEAIVPGRFQPRMDFDPEALHDLAESIREKGILQPILVRPLPEDSSRYELIAGERRWRAAQMAQRHSVPILIRHFSDREAAEVALVENLQRRDLSAMEEAEGYERLMQEFHHTAEDLARAIGKSRSHIANTVRLLALPPGVKDLVRSGSLTAGHARALVNAADPDSLAAVVVKKGLNVRQTEKLATEQGGVKARKPQTPQDRDPDTIALERDLSHALGLKVVLENQGRGGRLILYYEGLDQLDGLLTLLNGGVAPNLSESEDGDAGEAIDFAAVLKKSL